MNPCHTTAGLLRAGVAILTMATGVTGQAAATPEAAHQQYRVVVLPVDGGTDSYLAGYLNFAPLNNRGTIGVNPVFLKPVSLAVLRSQIQKQSE